MFAGLQLEKRRYTADVYQWYGHQNGALPTKNQQTCARLQVHFLLNTVQQLLQTLSGAVENRHRSQAVNKSFQNGRLLQTLCRLVQSW